MPKAARTEYHRASAGEGTAIADFLWIYILELANGNYYTGYTKDLERRYRQHRTGRGSARYTRSFRPLRLVRCWRVYGGIGTALKIETLIKSRERRAKELLVREPRRLKALVAAKLALEVKIVAVDPERLAGLLQQGR